MTYYFTFGQDHVHRVNGFTYDADVVVAVNAENVKSAREIMFRNFGAKWAFQYDKLPDMKYFQRGIKELNP